MKNSVHKKKFQKVVLRKYQITHVVSLFKVNRFPVLSFFVFKNSSQEIVKNRTKTYVFRQMGFANILKLYWSKYESWFFPSNLQVVQVQIPGIPFQASRFFFSISPNLQDWLCDKKLQKHSHPVIFKISNFTLPAGPF